MRTHIQKAFKDLLAPLGFSLGDITYETKLNTSPNGTITEEFYGYNVVIYLKTYTIKAVIVTISNEDEIEKKLMDIVNNEIITNNGKQHLQYL